MSTVWKTFLAIALCACTAELGAPDDMTGGVPIPLPPSLQGTEPDGDLHLDAHGRFVVDADATRFFDYFLTAEGEVPDHELHALVHAAIRRRLPASVAGEAEEAFARYLRYRAEAGEIVTDFDQTVAHAHDRLLRLHAGQVADMPGLAADPILFNRAVALHRVLSTPDMDRATRAARVAEIEAAMPLPGDELDAAAQHQTRLPLRLREAEQRLRARGSSSAEIHALRMDMVGPAAAERLARLDQERALWQQRVAAYRDARAALRSRMPGAATRDQAAGALAAIEAELTPHERLRLRALERIRYEKGIDLEAHEWTADAELSAPSR